MWVMAACARLCVGLRPKACQSLRKVLTRPRSLAGGVWGYLRLLWWGQFSLSTRPSAPDAPHMSPVSGSHGMDHGCCRRWLGNVAGASCVLGAARGQVCMREFVGVCMHVWRSASNGKHYGRVGPVNMTPHQDGSAQNGFSCA